MGAGTASGRGYANSTGRSPARWKTPSCVPSRGWTARRSRSRPGSPGGGCAGGYPDRRRPNWYDAGRFWSGDDLTLLDGSKLGTLLDGSKLGNEMAVRVPVP
jgi:hypothetical protein